MKSEKRRLGRCLPVGQQEANPILSRRQFLGGVASSSFLAGSVLAQATRDEGDLIRHDIECLVSKDGSNLTVSEFEVRRRGVTPDNPSGTEYRSVAVSWSVPAAAFGPKAWFDMAQPGPDLSAPRHLFIRDVSYGARHAVFVELILSRPGDGPDARWRIAFSTNLWLSSTGSRTEIGARASVPLASFLASDDVVLFESVTTNIAVRTLAAVFDGRIGAAWAAPPTCRIELNRHLVWVVCAESAGTCVLSCFERQINLPRLSFSWSKPEHEDLIFFSGEATLEVGDSGGRPKRKMMTQIAVPIRIGPGSGHHITVTASLGATLGLELICGASPVLPSQLITVATLRIPGGAVSVQEGGAGTVGPIDAANLVLSEIDMPLDKSARVTRTVLWGDVLGDVSQDDMPPADAASEKPSKRCEIASPIGRLQIGRPTLDSATKRSEPPKPAAVTPAADTRFVDATHYVKEAEQHATAAARLMQAATGDRIGAAGATLFVVYDRATARSPAGMRRIAIDIALYEAPAALPDVSYSTLKFDAADLRLSYEDGLKLGGLVAGEFPHQASSSFVWVGRVAGDSQSRPTAALDLSRATLTCARDYDLMKLRFRFNDFVLDFCGKSRPRLRAAHQDCRVLVRDDGTVIDSRPTLVVEFGPQHVMEEAIFRPEPPPLPDVELTAELETEKNGGKASIKIPKTREGIVGLLRSTNDVADRIDIRAKISEAKQKDAAFRQFARAYQARAARSSLPDEQCIYIGPFELDADAMALTRAEQQESGVETVIAAIGDMLARVDRSANDLTQLEPAAPEDAKGLPAEEIRQRHYSAALHREALLEQGEPLYAAFRDFWRDRIIRVQRLTKPRSDWNPDTDYLPDNFPEMPDRRLSEFLTPNNRPRDLDAPRDPMEREHSEDLAGQTDYLLKSMKRIFAWVALGKEPVEELQSARLSGPSRLAFRVNCQGIAGVGAEEAGLPKSSGDGPSKPGSDSTFYGPIEFSFEALTDWSRHEPAVTRRARKLFARLPSGIMPPLGNRSANANDLDILRFQGISGGAVTAAQRMTEVRAALTKTPTELETAIEIPARLILSTAQDAVWRTNRSLPPEIWDAQSAPCAAHDNRPMKKRRGAAAEAAPEGAGAHADLSHGVPELRDGRDIAPPNQMVRNSGPWDLWCARLAVADVAPSLRVIASPDLRPMALGGAVPGTNLRLPGQDAPPRGPLAPWFIGPEQMDSRTLDCTDVSGQLPLPDQRAAKQYCRDDAKAAPGTPDANTSSNDNRFPLLTWLVQRLRNRQRLPAKDYGIFRSSLDANDRHQLVLLSSAYGLPVIGRREAVDGDVKKPGALVKDSGQIEPGERYSLLDGEIGEAIYRPLPLAVQELSLTALGGSFLHDTTFKPPAGAADLFGRKIFDGLSIERWQHEIALGRDIRAEVVYKGYLLPLGHRACLVKLTERVFLRTTVKREVKAVLRQRLFLRVATPRKDYPAIGQPHQGRLWCGKRVTLLTTRTPDLLDPCASLDRDVKDLPESLNGRIDLGGYPGLAFWPRTDITPAGLVQFDIDVDGATTRLPLLFVDNIAATTPNALRAAVARYNGDPPPPTKGDDGSPPKEQSAAATNRSLLARRQLLFGGQKLIYAPESRPGDTGYATNILQVRAHGLVSEEAGGWTGILDKFATNSVLEGAEQPPFYPAMETATLRLTQAERFSGSGPMPVEVQYDGHYVRYGLPDPRAQTQDNTLGSAPLSSEKQNSAEVILNLAQAVKLDMGGNGDRSAGIGRPNSCIIALSRSKGLLGGDDDPKAKVTWRTGPSNIEPEEKSQLVDDAHRPVPLHVKEHRATLVSLAGYFNTNAAPGPAVVPRDTSIVAAVKPAVGEHTADIAELQRKLQVLQSYFSLDAKVLGTITIRQILFLLDINLAEIPALQEVIDYGTAAGQNIDQAAGDVANDIKTRVLLPLHNVIARLLEAWTKLDVVLQSSQRKALAQMPEPSLQGNVLTLAEVYPGVSDAIHSLDRIITEAMATQDALALPGKLAAIYQGAQRLIQALDALTSNPVERLQEAVAASVQARIATLKSAIGGLKSEIGESVRSLLTFADDIPEWVAQKIIPQGIFIYRAGKWIKDEVVKGFDKLTDNVPSPAQFEPQSEFVLVIAALLPPPDLPAIARASSPVGVGALDGPTLHKLQDVADRLLIALAGDVRAVLKELLEPMVAQILKGNVDYRDPGPWLEASLAKILGLLKNNAASAVSSALDEIAVILGTAPSFVKDRLSVALKDYAAYVTGFKSHNILAELPDFAPAVGTARRFAGLLWRVQEISRAAARGDQDQIWNTSATVAQEIFGVDLQNLSKDILGAIVGYLKERIAPVQQRLGILLGMDTTFRDILAAEVVACEAFQKERSGPLPLRGKPSLSSSIPFFGTLNQAILQLESAGDELSKINIPDSVQLPIDLRRFQSSLQALIAGDPKKTGLIEEMKLLYCTLVVGLVQLRVINAQLTDFSSSPTPVLDRRAIERLMVLMGSLRNLAYGTGLRLQAIIVTITGFTENNGAYLAAGGLAGGAAALATQTGIAQDVQQKIAAFQQRATVLETTLVVALSEAVTLAFDLVRNAGMIAANTIGGINKALSDIASEAGKKGVLLEPERKGLSDALENLTNEIEALVVLKKPDVSNLTKFLDSQIIDAPATSLRGLFQTSKPPYLTIILTLSRVEAKAAAAAYALALRLQELPARLRQALEDAIANSGAFVWLKKMYGGVFTGRNEVLSAAEAIPLIRGAAKKALVVEPDSDYIAMKDCLLPTPASGSDDRLWQEANVVGCRATPPHPPSDAEVISMRVNMARLMAAWTRPAEDAQSSAPRIIINNVARIAQNLFNGNILAVLDLGAYREQMEDAIASLIPTRARLSYDFSSTVQSRSDRDAIFQPQQGAPFGVQVRASVDLLNPQHNEFLAHGELGPFDIKLIGGLVDALRLKFGGAAFELKAGEKARFDVIYRGFEIGKDLDFTKPIEPFLSPKDGSGIFIQPLERAPGIEAGYGINLQTISVGAASFFNVILGISAELPFDSSDALFKVSLGRALSPFTTAVGVFAGSGYFAVFAAADGVRGFEASFEFGGGGSIGFGCLTAQARIQVGVYVRVLRVNGHNTTTIAGTFFAGGSASIWIFHFATSLSVRLGKEDGGAMYGEATFSFSFSLGIVSYNYSVTAFRREAPVGTGSGQKSARNNAPEPVRPLRVAMLNESNVLSDAGPPLAQILSMHATKKQKRAKGSGSSRPPDSSVYRHYFDLGLVSHLCEVNP
jgi:hypothetical protein